jgi:hypothetical protein
LNHVAFAQTAMEFANIYFEHGHQYEPMTRVVGPPTLEDSPRHLNYPLGSFMNRYLINPLERLDPFIDNIKPVQQALLKIVRNHPFHMVRLYVRAWRFLNRALQMRRMWDGPAVTIAAALFVPPLFAGLVVLFVVLPDAWAAVESRLSWLTRGRALAGGGIVGVLFPALLPYAVGFLQEMGRAFGLFKPRDPVAEGAHAVLERFARGNRWRRVYVVMGHTHRQDVQTRSAGYRYETYINTGTWIPLWPLDRQDLVGRIIYSFAQFDLTEEGEYAHLMLQWDDQAGHPRAARILARGPERYEDEC